MANQTTDPWASLTDNPQDCPQNAAAPIQPAPRDGDDQDEHPNQADGDEDDGLAQFANPAVLAGGRKAKKKKNRKKRPKSQRGLDKPTGFEEFYSDPPLTPEQHEENKSLYNPSLPFVDRILTAIQKFERTRKLTSLRRDIFYKYLAYGGIDVGPNMFQGVDQKSETTETMDKDQLTAAMARTSIAADKHENVGMYAIDFTGCVAGFLSRRAGDWFGLDTPEQVSVVTTTLERFMDYLLQQDVCPEHSSDVLRARNVCRTADTEMWAVAEAQRRLPGNFNAAFSTLYDGQYARNYDGETDWSTVGNNPTGQTINAHSFIGFTDQIARQLVSLGIAGAAEEQVYQDFMSKIEDGSLTVMERKEHTSFEITRIEPASKECKDLYRKESKDFKAVGRVYAKAWRNPEQPPEDLTEEERRQAELDNHNSTNGHAIYEDIYVFLIEDSLHNMLTVGMKVEASIHKLNCGGEGTKGLYFFDEVIQCFPSFDQWLVNEMMFGYKEPRPVKDAIGYVDNEGKWVLYREGEGPQLAAEDNEWVTGAEKDAQDDTGEGELDTIGNENGGEDEERTPSVGVV